MNRGHEIRLDSCLRRNDGGGDMREQALEHLQQLDEVAVGVAEGGDLAAP